VIAGGNSHAAVMRYTLPDDAKQGSGLWYTVRLHLLVFVRHSAGTCIVSASTNDDAAAQIEVTTRSTGATFDSLGWIDGHRIWHEDADVVALRFQNYLQVNGVRPGRNVLSVKTETLAGHCVSKVVVLPDTGIGTTRTRPDELRLLVPRDAIRGERGHRTTIPFRLYRRGGRPDGPVTVAIGSNRSFGLVGNSQLRFPRVGSGIQGSFVIVPRESEVSVSISVPRRLNQPTATLFVEASSAPPPWYRSQTMQFVLAASCVVGATLLLINARKHRGDRKPDAALPGA
jgi:hypothetical protein